MRSQGAAAEGRRVRDLIEAGLSEAAARLSAMGKVSARSATPMCQGLSRGRAQWLRSGSVRRIERSVMASWGG